MDLMWVEINKVPQKSNAILYEDYSKVASNLAESFLLAVI